MRELIAKQRADRSPGPAPAGARGGERRGIGEGNPPTAGTGGGGPSGRRRAARSPGRAPAGTGLNVLVLGGGGREYAIAWRLARSESVAAIDVIPGNPGMSFFTRPLDIPLDRMDRIEQHIAAAAVDLVIGRPDDLVASGIGDALRRTGASVVCPSREAAKLEWSKSFAKDAMRACGVPTAAFRT